MPLRSRYITRSRGAGAPVRRDAHLRDGLWSAAPPPGFATEGAEIVSTDAVRGRVVDGQGVAIELEIEAVLHAGT
jgi:hypothetical protein